MITHSDELALARGYEQAHDFERLTDAQVHAIMEKGRSLFRWFKAHPYLHNTINAAVILSVLIADYLVLVELPAVFLPAGQSHSSLMILLASAVAGSLHSYLVYSLSAMSLHEAAAHKIVFVGSGALARGGHRLAANLARLAASVPEYYSASHMAHHAKFGTEEDAEFLNFVVPRRYFLTLLPLAIIVNFTDFISHRPPTYTKGLVLSIAVATAYNLPYALIEYERYGLAFTLLTMFVFLPHVGFGLDRLRQFTEHNLMPLESKNGARSFGTGFWGLLVGGGPWGQPCHWEHHLVPSLPWYQQIALHRFVVKQLTPRQRKQFLIEPVIGFPRLWWRVIRELRTFRGSTAGTAPDSLPPSAWPR
jgi:hypothetical protein